MSRPAPRLLAVFDLDGTLIDSREVMNHAFRTAYALVVGTGEPPLDRFVTLLGAPFPDILAALGLPAAMDPVFRTVAGRGIERIRVYEGAVDACRMLRGRGVPVAVQTGKDRSRTLAILARFGLDRVVGAIVAGDDQVPGKPSPAGVLSLCRRHRVLPEHAVMVGDTQLDIAAGRAAGARTVGCAWGMAGADQLEAAGTDLVVHRPDDLTAALVHCLQLLGASAGTVARSR